MSPTKNPVSASVAAAIDPDDSPDLHRNPPQPNSDCLYGLIGDIARAGSETTEANPYAVGMIAMVYLSCAVGRGPYMPVGNTWHHARIFGLHVGRSGEGRKGDAVSLMRRIAHEVREIDENLAPQIHSGGLSSREGLVYLIHDGYREGKEEIPAIEDKRLLVIESEFANVLGQVKREGNTLSAAIRDLWDGMPLKPATKSNRLWASDPHVCLAAAITPSELRTSVASRELSNGFFNRLLPIWAERHRKLPFPKSTPVEDVQHLAQRVAEVLRFCGADRWVERDRMRVELSPEAAKRWSALYMDELNDRSHGERLNALIERRAPTLLRIAMLLALADLTTTVSLAHINAALAWVRYSVESVRFIFASASDEVETAETNETAGKIVRFVQSRGRVTRKQLTVECFAGHTSKDKIDAALDDLLSANPPRILVKAEPSRSGPPTKFYELPANSANGANNKEGRGVAADSVVREVCELSEQNAETVSTLRTLREESEALETRASIDSSHGSHSSHGDIERVEL